MKYIIPTVALLLLLGCSSEQQNTQEPSKGLVETLQTKASEATQQVGNSVKEGVEAAKQTTQDAVESVSKTAEEAQQQIVETTQKMSNDLQQATHEVKQDIAEATQEMANDIQETTQDIQKAANGTKAEFNAAATFKRKCASCHGATAEKSALGKSQIIKGWNADKIISALQGYKDGSYGGAMKGLMASQVSSLHTDEIKALADFISKQ